VLDLDWIPIVAAKEWLIITRDSRIAENPLEIAAVRENNAKMVALNQVDAQTKWGQLEVARLLRGRTWLTAVNAAEVCDQMVRVFGSDPDAVQADLALLGHTGMAVVPVSPEMAIEAGRIRARRYHREHAAVGLAGCMAAAAALAVQQPLATADSALAKVVRAEGGDIHPLPDSKGRLP
jgi:PIN domain nuclease of toxin-antitoxin system